MPEFEDTVLYRLLARIDAKDPESVHNAIGEIRWTAGHNIEAQLNAMEAGLAALNAKIDSLYGSLWAAWPCSASSSQRWSCSTEEGEPREPQERLSGGRAAGSDQGSSPIEGARSGWIRPHARRCGRENRTVADLTRPKPTAERFGAIRGNGHPGPLPKPGLPNGLAALAACRTWWPENRLRGGRWRHGWAAWRAAWMY